MEWGSGVSGQIILSDKAPSFPYIKLELEPVSWLKFVYFVWRDHVRKGQIELPSQQYQSPYPSTLYGPRLSITDMGIDANYSIAVYPPIGGLFFMSSSPALWRDIF
jgi:hypothetical protein